MKGDTRTDREPSDLVRRYLELLRDSPVPVPLTVLPEPVYVPSPAAAPSALPDGDHDDPPLHEDREDPDGYPECISEFEFDPPLHAD